jgi:hypothetical protein
VTAFDQYALRAFEVHALDFLLKPVSAEKLAGALERARTRIAERRCARVDPRVLALLDDLASRRRFLSRLPVKLRGKLVVINLVDVDWIEAADNYVTLHAGVQTYPAARPWVDWSANSIPSGSSAFIVPRSCRSIASRSCRPFVAISSSCFVTGRVSP